MKLSDVVSGMHLSIYAQVPLLVFMGVFVGVAVYLLRGRDDFARSGALPLRDERAPRRGDQ